MKVIGYFVLLKGSLVTHTYSVHYHIHIYIYMAHNGWTHWGPKWLTSCRQHFQMQFLGRKLYHHIQISYNFVLTGMNDNKSTLIQIMAWCLFGTEPLYKPMLAQFTPANINGSLQKRHNSSVLAMELLSCTNPSICTTKPHCMTCKPEHGSSKNPSRWS